MKNNFYVNSILLFSYILFGFIISITFLIHETLYSELESIITYIIINVFLIYMLYITSFSIELFKEEFTVKRLFGLGKTSTYNISDIKKIIFKTDYTELISNIKIYFKDGKSIQIHKFQKNFDEALYVIKDEFKDVHIEYKDKSDFFY